MSCFDKFGRSVTFRDIKGADLEYLQHILDNGRDFLTRQDVMEILEFLLVAPENALIGKLTPRTIEKLYESASKNILCNFMSKENWLRSCYAIQNGSFQNLEAMEQVPMSKFAAMCSVHKQAMDQIKNNNDNTIPIDEIQQ